MYFKCVSECVCYFCSINDTMIQYHWFNVFLLNTSFEKAFNLMVFNKISIFFLYPTGLLIWTFEWFVETSTTISNNDIMTLLLSLYDVIISSNYYRNRTTALKTCSPLTAIRTLLYGSQRKQLFGKKCCWQESNRGVTNAAPIVS